jgi:hypothetical protein
MAIALPRALPGCPRSANETTQAPVAQLDRALPSEGKGQRFESPRARHTINDLGGPDLASVPEVSRRVCGKRGIPPREPRDKGQRGAPRRARVPPIDYGDGLPPCLTNPQETDITTIIQRCHQHPSRTGRDRSEQVVAIRRNQWSRSSECATQVAQLVTAMASYQSAHSSFNPTTTGTMAPCQQTQRCRMRSWRHGIADPSWGRSGKAARSPPKEGAFAKGVWAEGLGAVGLMPPPHEGLQGWQRQQRGQAREQSRALPCAGPGVTRRNSSVFRKPEV